MKRILVSLLSVSLLVTLGIFLTNAFFSDTETSTGNVLLAGELDLKVDNESYYNGVLNENTSWTVEDLTDQLFFNFDDLKPDDYGEDTISLRAENDYWACMNVDLTANDDVTCTEPELADDPNCAVPGASQGELGGLIEFLWWADDGDNVLEAGEKVFKEGSASSLFDGEEKWTIADSTLSVFGETEPLPGGETTYIGKAWCFGDIGVLDPRLNQDNSRVARSPAGNNNGDELSGTPEDGGFTCDGTTLDNASQTDNLLGDVTFEAIQARNNPSFTCSEITPSVSPSVSPSVTPTPTLACSQADVMLVLDRSGSINSTELGQLKTAAKDFVDALGLTTLGIHAGQTSFATTGTHDHNLTDNETSLKAAIDALVSGGFTNLKEGIDLANVELASVRDRADLSSPDKMIIVTDGHPNRPLPSGTADDQAATSADAARAAGVEIFVVGVGSDVDATYLQNEIADPDDPGEQHYYSTSDYSGLETALENLDLCNGD